MESQKPQKKWKQPPPKPTNSIDEESLMRSTHRVHMLVDFDRLEMSG